jgi:hypothetical protein
MSQEKKSEEKFDRVEFMKSIRQELMIKLDLPENTKPERLMHLVQIKKEMAKIRRDPKKNH